jgi:alpha-galactosidase
VLNHVSLLELASPGRAGFGDGEESARIYEEAGYFACVRGIAEQAPTPAVYSRPPEPTENDPHALAQGTSRTVWELHNPTVGQALLVGFDSFERWMGVVRMAFAEGAGVTTWTLAFDGGDLRVEPAEELALESVVWMMDPDPWRLLERWGEHVQRKHDLRPPGRSPVSWCSWYPYRLTVSEELVLANAQVAATRLKPLGLSIMEVDLGWEAGFLPSEYRENDQFAHGLGWLSERLGEYGFALGAWNAPFTVSEFQSMAKEHPEWLLRDAGGRPASFGRWYWEPHGDTHVVDLTHPGAQAWLRENIASLARRGVRYLKCDFISAVHAASLRHRHDPRIVGGGGFEAGRLGCRIIRDEMAAVDPDALILNCSHLEMPGLGLFGLLYTCYDTGNTGYVGWRHLRDVYTAVACHLYQQGRWGIIEPSCLCVGPPGTLEEARVRATATFLCGGEVNISDDLTRLPEDRWQVLLSVLPPLSKPAKPVDLFDGEYPSVWHLRVEADWDSWDLVGLFNFDLPSGRYHYGDPESRTFRVPLERLGLDPTETDWAYEFWSGAFLGEANKALEPTFSGGCERDPGEVQAHEVSGALEFTFFGPAVKLVALRRARPHPWVVGTGFHQSVGAELRGVRWDETAGELRGELHRPAGHSGSITVAAPGRGEPAATVAGRPAPVCPGAAGAWVLPIVCAADVTPWTVRFER